MLCLLQNVGHFLMDHPVVSFLPSFLPSLRPCAYSLQSLARAGGALGALRLAELGKKAGDHSHKTSTVGEGRGCFLSDFCWLTFTQSMERGIQFFLKLQHFYANISSRDTKGAMSSKAGFTRYLRCVKFLFFDPLSPPLGRVAWVEE